MPDDLTKRGPADAARVNTTEKHEIAYWTGKWSISAEQLKKAHAAVGPMAADIEKYLRKNGMIR